MRAHHFAGERMDAASQKSFPEITAALEKQVPSADLSALFD